MPSNEPSLRQGRSPSGASVAALDSASFSCRSGPLPSTLDYHVQRQSSLMRQTPYERKLTGFSPGDTKILLGQSDFHETLKRPAVRKFASIRQPAAEAEQQPERSGSSGHVNKTWDKIRSWSKNTFSRGKSGECSATDGEKSRAGGCEPDQNGQGSEQGRGTGRDALGCRNDSTCLQCCFVASAAQMLKLSILGNRMRKCLVRSQEQLTDFRVLHCKRAKAAHSG